jgi:hypothetical protein
MWRTWSLLILTLAVLVGDTAVAWSEEASCPTTKPLTVRQKWVRFAIMQGRLTASVALGQTATLTCGNEGQWQEETFGVHANPQGTSVRYTIRQGRETTTFHFAGPDNLTVERITAVAADEVIGPDNSPPTADGQGSNASHDVTQPSDARPRLTLRQQTGSEIELILGEPGIGPSYQAPTLWHLMLTEHDLAETELFPLLERLRPDWQLERKARQIESLLVAQPLSEPAPALEDILARLGDNRFEVRRRADQELRSHGPSLLPLLDQLDPRQLNSEQTLRIRKLRESMVIVGDDLPHHVAGWLSYDRRLGERWLARGSNEHHAFAKRQQSALDRSQVR